MSNQLRYSTSPYLLQHAENPVNWYMWCDEAFEKAKSENKPFFAGTYFPVRLRYGMPGFSDLLMTIAEQWEKNQDKLLESADEIKAHLKKKNYKNEKNNSENIIEEAIKHFKYIYDSIYGGFVQAPKFPTPHNLLFLMMYSKISDDSIAMKIVEKTLLQMRKGGIFDHIGGGFSRYFTDKCFLAPYFEKTSVILSVLNSL